MIYSMHCFQGVLLLVKSGLEVEVGFFFLFFFPLPLGNRGSIGEHFN